jgi:dipeptidyl aminopeptidase/acylaminoacyl peptidase
VQRVRVLKAKRKSGPLVKIALIAGLVTIACITIAALILTWPKSFLGQNLNLLKDSDGRIVSCESLDVGYSENVECYRLRYLSDGLEVVGFLVKPRQGNVHPAVIFNRGGQQEYSKIDNATLAYLSYVASVENCVFVASQYRGNDGGQGREEFGGSDVNDVLNLIPMLESLPFVDPDKIAMVGFSRGGMMTYIAITMTDKVKAACVVGGITDLIQWYNERPDMRPILIELIGGSPEEKENEYTKRSACYWPEKINTPILILHGGADWRVDVGQAEKLANKLEELGKTYELVIYPGGSHELEGYMQDVLSKISEWFEKYLQ